MTLQQDYITKSEELRVKRAAAAELWEKLNAETDPKKTDDLASSWKTANAELAPLVDKVEELGSMVKDAEANAAAIKATRQPVNRQVNPADDTEPVDRDSFSDEILAEGIKSIRSLISGGLETNGLKTVRDGGRGLYGFRGELGELAIKALIQTSGMTPLEERRPGIVLSPQEERTVSDLMLEGTTTAQKITYFEETTFTNAAAETAEAAEKPESTLEFTLREDNVRKIATWVPVTDEMLEDVPGFESYLRARLGFMVRQREELQLLRGNGSGQNIQGVYNRTGVQTVTGYGMSTIDSILKGITEVQKDAFVEPTALVIHPNDWFEVRTSKDSQGQYLLGPATQDPMATRPWGLQVRVTTNALENTALVGAFNQAQVFRRSGIAIAISTENQDYFIYNKLAVRAEERLALAVYRPAAFCKVEAIVQGS